MGPYAHFMQKEIFEQPGAVANTLEMVLNARSISPRLFGSEAENIFKQTEGILILACGTSYHAGLVARYWLESVAGLTCNVEIASEYRYRDPVSQSKSLVVGISQSGETADTLAALSYAKSLGHRHSLAICNVAESALVRQANLRFLTRAGPEIGVASTKAFTTQLAVLACFVIAAGQARGTIDGARAAGSASAISIARIRRLRSSMSLVLCSGPWDRSSVISCAVGVACNSDRRAGSGGADRSW
jgi:glucosamine--fructose-6-phosphate aminotransferase (isomerizing)